MVGDKGASTKLMYQVFVALNRKVREEWGEHANSKIIIRRQREGELNLVFE